MSMNYIVRKQFHGVRGFALVEVLIAFVVLAAGLLTLLSFHGATQKSNANAKIQAEAVAFAEAKLQELESYLGGGDPRLIESNDSDTPDGLLVSFNRSWSITDDAVKPDLKAAQVTVNWTDRDGIAQNVVLRSDIHVIDPPVAIIDFMKLVAVAENAGGGSWSTGDNPTDPTDPGDPTDPNNPVDPSDPTDQPEPIHTVYTLIISGILTGANGSQFQGADGIEDVAADPELIYPTNCEHTKTTFECEVQYNNRSVGWTGAVVLKSNKDIYKNGAGSCETAAKTLSLDYSGVNSNQTNIVIVGC